MFSAHVSAILVKGGLTVASLIGFATIAAAPAAANTARGVVSYSTPNYSGSVASELSTSNVVTGSEFGATITLIENGATGSDAILTVTATADADNAGVASLRDEVVKTLNSLSSEVKTSERALDAYVGILKAAAGADGLEDVVAPAAAPAL